MQQRPPSVEARLAEITHLTQRRAQFLDQPRRTNADLAEIAQLTAQIETLWTQHHQQQADAYAAQLAARTRDQHARRLTLRRAFQRWIGSDQP